MMCKQCGADVVADAAFCHVCGASLAGLQDRKPRVPPRGGDAANPTGKERFAQRFSAGADPDDAEEFLWQGHFSKLAMVGEWIGAVLATMAVLVVTLAWNFTGEKWLWAALAAFWIFLLLRLIYRQLSIRYSLTSQRLIHEHGILWRRTDRIEAIDIDDVTYHQGPVERMLGIGTIRIASSDHSTPQFALVGIEDARRVATLIDEVRRKERRKRGVHIESI